MQPRSYLFLLLVLGLAGLSIAGLLYKDPNRSGGNPLGINLGLDVVGGIRLTYQIDKESIPEDADARMSRIRSDLQKILTNRVSAALGVVEGNVQSKGEDQFVVEIPGFKDVAEAKRTLSSTAKLVVYHATNVSTERVPNRRYSESGREEDEAGPYVTFRRRGSDEPLVPGTPEYEEMIAEWTVILEGQDLADASAISNPDGTYKPTFRFSESGARAMETWTRANNQRGEMLAFVLDGRVLSIAPIARGAIIRDQGEIQGSFEPGYVTSLTELLKAGSLPVELTLLSSQTVDPTIGTQAFQQMVNVGVIAFVVIALFLIVYYMFPGFVALIALCLYVLFTLVVLKFLGATFSLASVAALVLSVGMAVDANILVFERFKEEMRGGRSLLTAVNLGFKRAFPAILDSNVCTIITSLVLLYFGTGPVKGFATTLILGVGISLFTAITVTRSLLVFLVGTGIGTNPKWYALGRNWFGEGFEAKADTNPLKIVDHWRKYLVISAVLIVPGLIFVALGGIRQNVEFSGGYEAEYVVPAGDNVTAGEILGRLEEAGIEGANVKFARSDDETLVYLTVPPLDRFADMEADAANTEITEAAGLSMDNERGFTYVGPTIQQETITNAILGVSVSLGLIMLYLGGRFSMLGGFKNGIRFGIAAVIAVFQAVLVVFGSAAIFGFALGWEISALFLTSILTVIGFQVHDTIVIFDRIRENLRKPLKGETFGNLCNRSISQSLARSLNTAATVVVTLILLIAFGTATIDLKFFCVAMLIGIVVGTYGSLFLATPVLYLGDLATLKRKGPGHGILAEAQRELKIRAQLQEVAEDRPTVAKGAAAGTDDYGTVKRKSVARSAERTLDEDEDEHKR